MTTRAPQFAIEPPIHAGDAPGQLALLRLVGEAGRAALLDLGLEGIAVGRARALPTDPRSSQRHWHVESARTTTALSMPRAGSQMTSSMLGALGRQSRLLESPRELPIVTEDRPDGLIVVDREHRRAEAIPRWIRRDGGESP